MHALVCQNPLSSRKRGGKARHSPRCAQKLNIPNLGVPRSHPVVLDTKSFRRACASQSHPVVRHAKPIRCACVWQSPCCRAGTKPSQFACSSQSQGHTIGHQNVQCAGAWQSPGCERALKLSKLCGSCSYQVLLDTDLTSYFDVEGYLAEPAVKKDVLTLLEKFEKQSPKPALNDKKSL
jgi:hypothetical protein